MGKYESQRAAFNFLRQHLLSGEPFLLREFIEATGWEKPGTYRTYLQKQYRGLIEPIDGSGFKIALDEEYRVTEAFRNLLDWRRFRQQVTQNRPLGGDYTLKTSKVLIYDFLMPLTHETHLRTTLDALFYKNTILAKLKTTDESEVEKYFTPTEGQSRADYLAEILSFIEKNFVGYSIYHVDGRFRSPGILDFDEIAVLSKDGAKYLIDETTAVTRFIFPYDDPEQLDAIRFLFQRLFVSGMIDLVAGEREIWMLENGPVRLVHIWKAPNDDSLEADEGDDL